jgi:hypothetical protein
VDCTKRAARRAESIERLVSDKPLIKGAVRLAEDEWNREMFVPSRSDGRPWAGDALYPGVTLRSAKMRDQEIRKPSRSDGRLWARRAGDDDDQTQRIDD